MVIAVAPSRLAAETPQIPGIGPRPVILTVIFRFRGIFYHFLALIQGRNDSTGDRNYPQFELEIVDKMARRRVRGLSPRKVAEHVERVVRDAARGKINHFLGRVGAIKRA